MKKLIEVKFSIRDLDNFAKKLSFNIKTGDVFLLKGELGSGKTTFARFLINSLFNINNLKPPTDIKSPSFPIMINYSLNKFEIFHYDFYRIDNKNEIKEIDIFENIEQNITIIEWPELILKNFAITNFFLMEFRIINSLERSIKLSHSQKKKI